MPLSKYRPLLAALDSSVPPGLLPSTREESADRPGHTPGLRLERSIPPPCIEITRNRRKTSNPNRLQKSNANGTQTSKSVRPAGLAPAGANGQDIRCPH